MWKVILTVVMFMASTQLCFALQDGDYVSELADGGRSGCFSKLDKGADRVCKNNNFRKGGHAVSKEVTNQWTGPGNKANCTGRISCYK